MQQGAPLPCVGLASDRTPGTLFGEAQSPGNNEARQGNPVNRCDVLIGSFHKPDAMGSLFKISAGPLP